MAVRIGLGLADFPFSDAAAFWRWVGLCEEGDIDSLWQTDRLVSSLPFLECMSAMAALAGATRRIKFGMNVASVVFRDPLVLAKECATIDFLSQGRLLPAFGIGNIQAPEWKATGRDTKGRGRQTDEALDIIAALWRGEAVTYEGQHYRYREARIAPLPVQKPLPLWIGGSSEAAIRRTARIGTGWQAGLETPAEVAPVVAAIKRAAQEAGRSIDPEHYGGGFFYRFGSWEDEPVAAKLRFYTPLLRGRDPRALFVVGGAEDILRRVRDYAEAGIAKFILRPIGQGDADIFAQTHRLIAEVLPEVHGRQVTALARSPA